jgi:hypothetical protein
MLSNLISILIKGSQSVSELLAAFVSPVNASGPVTATFRVTVTATPVAAAMVRPTCRVAASDFYLALAKAGAVGDSILRGAVAAAAARASGEEVSPDVAAAAAKHAERVAELAAEFTASLPDVERRASWRVSQGKAELIAN